MQKRSTSQSAFVNLRVVVGFSIFPLAVFLALYQRLNDITDPSNTDLIGDLVARDILAGTFIGNDFSQHFGIDDCCKNSLRSTPRPASCLSTWAECKAHRKFSDGGV